ncbi:hypothetical protein GA0115240_15239 [Streptomyces sp. DvalAA-14]|uniref:hypothetical protein n=1 Tax=unclassified Streptomyces TaxID=2593676 RepID=UPI00081B80C5|nr:MULTISPECIES: hypothetical protein [unclassified Streptomyces]MYS23367.1 hypothetical protein [Streptomyces sp. SID4948]SCE32257.1 hypothetical protein GA0115240_15239 [Streptomyces sp. DvalAA-14]
MTITDDIVKGLRNPTPLYAVAGTADLAAEKLREVPALIGRIREQAPDQFGKIRSTDPKTVQERVAAQAKDAQTRLNETFADLDLKELRDFKRLGESVQDLALQGVGRAAEYAVRARETYDELAVRGKGAVATWRGEAADEVVEIAAAVEPTPDPAPAPAAEEQAKPAAPKKSPGRRTSPKKASDDGAE